MSTLLGTLKRLAYTLLGVLIVYFFSRRLEGIGFVFAVCSLISFPGYWVEAHPDPLPRPLQALLLVLFPILCVFLILMFRNPAEPSYMTVLWVGTYLLGYILLILYYAWKGRRQG